MPKSRPFILIIIIFSLLAVGNAYSYEDGFGQADELETEHFTVYYAPQLDASALAQKLSIGFSDRILAGTDPQLTNSSDQAELAESLDTLFLSVCNILDMHLYSFKGTLKICRDKEQLNSIYTTLFDKSLGGKFSFYVFDLNTIYISQEYFEREVLGHEIAHAIISNYFVVHPPVKASEILAGYVEYQLRKAGER